MAAEAGSAGASAGSSMDGADTGTDTTNAAAGAGTPAPGLVPAAATAIIGTATSADSPTAAATDNTTADDAAANATAANATTIGNGATGATGTTGATGATGVTGAQAAATTNTKQLRKNERSRRYYKETRFRAGVKHDETTWEPLMEAVESARHVAAMPAEEMIQHFYDELLRAGAMQDNEERRQSAEHAANFAFNMYGPHVDLSKLSPSYIERGGITIFADVADADDGDGAASAHQGNESQYYYGGDDGHHDDEDENSPAEDLTTQPTRAEKRADAFRKNEPELLKLLVLAGGVMPSRCCAKCACPLPSDYVVCLHRACSFSRRPLCYGCDRSEHTTRPDHRRQCTHGPLQATEAVDVEGRHHHVNCFLPPDMPCDGCGELAYEAKPVLRLRGTLRYVDLEGECRFTERGAGGSNATFASGSLEAHNSEEASAYSLTSLHHPRYVPLHGACLSRCGLPHKGRLPVHNGLLRYYQVCLRLADIRNPK